MNAERRPVLFASDWHPIANFILALTSLVMAIYFWVHGETQTSVLCLVVLALCI